MNRSMRHKNSKIDLAHKRLHPSNAIKELPCRRQEYNDMYNFVKSSLVEQVGGCMFISGVPGTGKTATVQCVMRDILNDKELKSIKNKVMMLEINGLKLSDPNQFYAHFYYKVFGKRVAKQKAIEELEDYFQNPDPKEPFIVLLVDELDQLCTKKQNIFYHLFDWPNRADARIAILSIANTMDLPERVMMNKIQSRLGMRRLRFQSYRFEELIEIVTSRLDGLELFQENALVLIARKVASISGDARRVLDLCRRALDIAEQQLGSTPIDKLTVNMSHVKSALDEVFSTDKVIAISNCTEQEKTFLFALMQEFRIIDSEDAYFHNVYNHHTEKCRMDKMYVPTVRELIDIARDLYAKRLILIEKNKPDIKCKIQLNVSIDEIEYVLN